MKNFVSGWKRLWNTEGAIAIGITVAIVLFLFVLYIQNGSAAKQIFEFTFLSATERIKSFLIAFFDLTSNFSPATVWLTVLSAAFGGLSASALSVYYIARKKVFDTSTLALSGLAYAIALIGLECGACGAVLLTSFLGLFGGAWIIQALPLHGFEIGVLGLLIQAILFYSLIKKLSNPFIC